MNPSQKTLCVLLAAGEREQRDTEKKTHQRHPGKLFSGFFPGLCFPLLLLLMQLLLPPILKAENPAFLQIPLTGRNMHPLYLAAPPLPARSARLPGQGERRLEFAIHWGNNFIVEGLQPDKTIDLELDTEALYTSISWSLGLTDWLEINLALAGASHLSGILDPLIHNFHMLFGFPNGGRELRPQNAYRIIIDQDGSLIINEKIPPPVLFHLSAELRAALVQNLSFGPGKLSLTAGLLGAAPFTLTGEEHPLVSSAPHGVSGALRLYLAYTIGPWFTEAAAGAALMTRPAFLKEEHFTGILIPFDLTIGRSFGSRLSILATVSGSSSPFRLGYRRTDRFSATANIGSHIALSSRDSLQLSFTQEFFTFAATDIGFHLGWKRRW